MHAAALVSRCVVAFKSFFSLAEASVCGVLLAVLVSTFIDMMCCNTCCTSTDLEISVGMLLSHTA